MKKWTLVLLVLGVCLMPAVAAQADPIQIPIGSFSYEEWNIPSTFTVTNLTGDGHSVSTPLWLFLPTIFYGNETETADAISGFTSPAPGDLLELPAQSGATWGLLSLIVGLAPGTPATTPFALVFEGNTYWVSNFLATASLEPDWMFGSLLLEGEPLSVIPEPATLLLVGTGIVGAWRARRRR